MGKVGVFPAGRKASAVAGILQQGWIWELAYLASVSHAPHHPHVGSISQLTVSIKTVFSRTSRPTCLSLSLAYIQLSDVQFSSVTQSCPTLCDPMDCSMPGFPVHHHLPEPAQTHVHRVSDAIQPSHPLSSPSPPTFNLSQHQGLFQ